MKRLAIALGIAFLVWIAIHRVNRTVLDLSALESAPSPARTFEAASARIEALQKLEGPEVAVPCRTRLYSHGRKTARVIVLLHGLTNCPQQYSQFAPRFYNQGDNVFVPRMPRNGMVDVESPEMAKLTAVEMRKHADEVADIAAGLGEKVVIVGFSAGGVISSWIAQNREVDLVFAISPALGVTTLPVSRFLARLVHRVPNFTVPIRRIEDPPFHTYTGYSSKSLGEMLRLSEAVFEKAKKQPPKAKKMVFVINPSDKAVNESEIRHLAGIWKRVELHEFRADLELVHDLIDPTQRLQRVSVVYPALEHWINAASK